MNCILTFSIGNRFLLSSTTFSPSLFLSQVHNSASTDSLLAGLDFLSRSIEKKSASLKVLVGIASYGSVQVDPQMFDLKEIVNLDISLNSEFSDKALKLPDSALNRLERLSLTLYNTQALSLFEGCKSVSTLHNRKFYRLISD